MGPQAGPGQRHGVGVGGRGSHPESLPSTETDHGLANGSTPVGVLWDLRPWQLPVPALQPRWVLGGAAGEAGTAQGPWGPGSQQGFACPYLLSGVPVVFTSQQQSLPPEVTGAGDPARERWGSGHSGDVCGMGV